MITGLSHVAIKVFDMNTELDFYCNTLGFTKIQEIYDSRGNLRLVILRISENSFLELFRFGALNEEEAYIFSGYIHICFEVSDIYEMEKMLRDKGVWFKQEIKKGQDKNYQFFIQDPEGNELEFTQIMPQSEHFLHRI